MENTYTFNQYQTQITEEIINKYPKEVIDDFNDYLNTVPYIQRLVSIDRKYACDLMRDEEDKIIVDISNPHILENMDYFRQTAIHFQKYGCFTKLKFNQHPHSEWMRWFKEECKRCWDGMIRPEDGEWITGDMYFFLNYSPMSQTVISFNPKTKRKIVQRKEDLPEVWEGIYLRFHYLHQAQYGGIYNNWLGQLHGAEIASRGKGKSFSMASLLAKCFSIGTSKDTSENRKALIVADNKEFLIKDGTLNKFEDMVTFMAKHTEFPTTKIKDSLTTMNWISGWVDSNGMDRGPQNEILGVPIGDNASKSRGKRSSIMIAEEFGSFGKFSEWWSTSMPNVQEGAEVFGVAYCVGTGGEDGNDFSGALDMIQSPESNHIYGVPNVYDKGSNGSRKTVFFFPAYVNYKPFYNKDGVSDVVGAMLHELNERYNIKYNSIDPLKITKRKAEFAFTIQDAIMRKDSTIYPVADINDRINQIDSVSTSLDDMIYGDLMISNSTVSFTPNVNKKPILHFPHKDNKLEGAVHIKTLPIRDSKGNIPWGRYIAGADPYDDDVSGTLSLGSIFILDLWTDDIVAEYTGRGMFAEDYYEICRRMCLFYNAELNYENNKKGLFAYFSKHNSLYLLCDTLEFLKDKDETKISYSNNKTKGTANYSNTKSGGVASYGRRCIRDYLLKPHFYVDHVEVEGETQEVEKTVPNLHRIKFRALLCELAMWNPDGNFDRHDALVMLMLLREDKLRLNGDDSFSNRKKEVASDYLGNDNYFESNYKNNKEEAWKKQLEKLGLLPKKDDTNDKNNLDIINQ